MREWEKETKYNNKIVISKKNKKEIQPQKKKKKKKKKRKKKKERKKRKKERKEKECPGQKMSPLNTEKVKSQGPHPFPFKKNVGFNRRKNNKILVLFGFCWNASTSI